MNRIYAIISAVFVIVFLTAVFVYTKDAEISGDTMPLITNAFHTLKFDYVPTFPSRHPGFASAYFQMFVSLFGFDTIAEYRIVFLVAFALAFIPVYIIGRDKGGLVALLAVFLTGLNMFTATDTTSAAQNQSFAVILQVVAVCSFYIGWEKDRSLLPLAAFFAAIALYNREEAAFLPLFFAVYLAIRERGIRWLRLKIVVTAALIYSLSVLPLLTIHLGLKDQNLGLFVTTFHLAKNQIPNPDVFYYVRTLPDLVPLSLLFFVFLSLWQFIRQRDVWRLFVLVWFSFFLMIVSLVPSKALGYGLSFHPALFLLMADGFAEAVNFARLKLKNGFIVPFAVFIFFVLAVSNISGRFMDEKGNFAWPHTNIKEVEDAKIAEELHMCPHAYFLGTITPIEYYLPNQAVSPGWISDDLDLVIEKTRPQVMVLDLGNVKRYNDTLRRYRLVDHTSNWYFYQIEQYKCYYDYDRYSKFVIGRLDIESRSYPMIWKWPEVLPWYTGRLQPFPVRPFLITEDRQVDLSSEQLMNMDSSKRGKIGYEYPSGSLIIEEKGDLIDIYLTPHKNIVGVVVMIGDKRFEYPRGISSGSTEKIVEASFK